VRRVRPDVVLLDIRLPGIDGWAVLEALKADPATRDIPSIVVSIVDERARGVALGAAAYLVKPISRTTCGALTPWRRRTADATDGAEGRAHETGTRSWWSRTTPRT
jgi:CheY-like chemotaxis protein